MSEITKEQGRDIARAYFVCGGRDVQRNDFMESGQRITDLVLCDESEEDRKDFFRGWEQGWEDSTLYSELTSQEHQSIIECTRLLDRRFLSVERQTFRRARLCLGSPGEFDGGYETTYDYDSPEAALIAFQNILGEDKEPDGWIRHRDTGRYRINGDSALEWVKDDDKLSLEQNIIEAVKFAKGQGFFVDSIQENSLHIDGRFPARSQCFTVASSGVVRWIVYHYHDRSVVLSVEEMENISIGNVIERLKGGKDI